MDVLKFTSINLIMLVIINLFMRGVITIAYTKNDYALGGRHYKSDEDKNSAQMFMNISYIVTILGLLLNVIFILISKDSVILRLLKDFNFLNLF